MMFGFIFSLPPPHSDEIEPIFHLAHQLAITPMTIQVTRKIILWCLRSYLLLNTLMFALNRI